MGDECVTEFQQKLTLSDSECNERPEEILDETDNKDIKTSSEKNTVLHFSAAHGIVSDIMRDLQLPNQKIDDENFMGWTPLMMAVRNGHVEAVKTLLEKGADVSRKNKFGMNILIMSIASGHLEIVKMILRHMLRGGISRNRMQEYISPLSMALLFKQTYLLNWLIQKNFSPNSPTCKTGLTPLMFAAAVSPDKLIHLLEIRGANINCKNYMGFTHHHMKTWRSKGLNYLNGSEKKEAKIQVPVMVKPSTSPVVIQPDVEDKTQIIKDADHDSPAEVFQELNSTFCAALSISPKKNESPKITQPQNDDNNQRKQERIKKNSSNPNGLVNKTRKNDLSLNSLSTQAYNDSVSQQQYAYSSPTVVQYPGYLLVDSSYHVPNVNNNPIAPMTPVIMSPAYQNFISTIYDHSQSPMQFMAPPQNVYQGTTVTPQVFFASQMPMQYPNVYPNGNIYTTDNGVYYK
ncbi:hypothetical protein HHI36_023451 [Cryptolaemus montrouzieri]|uniref:Uncharacterized protein n=1 Tax=Cryptolaemus montrouzieri TaxID=559131 RepID=A0ABD2PH66_9CUCU